MASIPEVPGVRTQGKTREEARTNILDALRTVLATEAEDAADAAPGQSIEHLEFALTA